MMEKKYTWELIFFKKSFVKKLFWIALLLVGEESATVKGRKTFFRVCSFVFFVIEKYFQNKSFFWKVRENLPKELHRIVEKTFLFRKSSFSEKAFSCIFVWTTFLSVGVQRSDDRKEKLYFGENILCFIFVLLKKKLVVLV